MGEKIPDETQRALEQCEKRPERLGEPFTHECPIALFRGELKSKMR